MKRLLSLLLSAVFILCAAAIAVSCGEVTKPEQSVTDAASGSSSAESETTVGTEPDDTQTQPSETATESDSDIESAVSSASETETETSSLTDTETDTVSETTEPPTYIKHADYADLDFGGKTFKIIYRWEPPEEKPSGWGFYFDLYEDADNPDDILTAAVALRRNLMKTFYNCDVVGVPSMNASGEASTAINTGTHEYDLVLAQYMLTSYGTSKLYYNLLPMINLSYDCWDDSLIRDYAFANKIYGITGDLSLSDDESMLVMLFNKDILAENNFEYPYELVRKGEWTLSKLIEMSRLCAKEVGGDGEYDTQNDIFGTVMWADCWEFLYIGCGGRFLSPIKSDGTVDWAGAALGYEADIYTMCIEYLNDPTTGGTRPAIGVPDGGTQVVGRGHAAFFLSQLSNITSTKSLSFRDFEDFNFGILPVPKWDESQTKYYSTFSTNIGLYAAPITGVYSTITDFLNVYALTSQETVQKAYTYMITYSYASDANVEEMLEIANAGRVWDYSLYSETSMNVALTSDCRAGKNRWTTRLTSGEKNLMASAKRVAEL